jgi:PHD/YefM family antitoxin component YafN of YafNO toxin-antitoxin module
VNYLTAQDLKRRGIGAVDHLLEEGPVYVVKNNQPRYVVLATSEYEALLRDLAEARLAASEADLAAGHVRRGTADELLRAAAGKGSKA